METSPAHTIRQGPERPLHDAAGARAGPTPAETDAQVWASINEANQRRRNAGARALDTFIRDTSHVCATPKRDERTNVIDQGDHKTYAFGHEHLQALYRHLEACRLEGSVVHFSERQATAAAPRSGIMLDFDLVVSERRPALTDRHYFRLAGALVAALQRDVDVAAAFPAPAGRPAEARLHIFFIVKPEAVPLAAPGGPGAPGAPGGPGAPGAAQPAAEGEGLAAAGGPPAPPQLYKYGFHILLPALKLARPYKRWLSHGLAADPAVAAALKDLGIAGPPESCLDQNSASVPVLFFGSCKRGGRPYVLGAALEVTVDTAAAGGGWAPPPVVRRLGDAELAGYNLVAELGLNAEAEYADGREPLVRKRDAEPRPETAEAALGWAARAAPGGDAAEELLTAGHALDELLLRDADARTLHALLDVVGPEGCDRARWRDVVFALASGGEAYRPLAVDFSQRCRHRSRPDARTDDLDALWADAVGRRAAGGRLLSTRSIHHWARAANPRRYAEVMNRSHFTMLSRIAYDYGGRLEHALVAKILYVMLGAKFCVDVDVGPRGSETHCWFEFVTPGEAMTPGEVWKWRREVEPDNLHIHISDQISRVVDDVSRHFEERRAAAADEAEARYYKALGAEFARSKARIHNDGFKNGVVKQAQYLFRRRGFAAGLDKDPDLFGVANGVLRVGARCALIDHYHEFPVSRFSPVCWRPFDPADPWQRLVLDAIADIIVEADARDWILFHACQGLSAETKEGVLLMWCAGGQNGKTSFLRWVAKCLGYRGAKFNIQLMSCEREDADRPNSAVMRFDGLNWAYAEETNKAQVLNTARLKEMVNAGEVSGRDLNQKQREFTMKANIVAASQHNFIVPATDHGTWRRLRYYTGKAKFRQDPDPNSPFEKKEDQRFVRQFPDDPAFQTAFLAILSHYYERLQVEFGGELKNVPCPTIERETEAFRIGQDALYRWICERVVLSPGCAVEYPLGVLGGYYTEWYAANVERRRHVASDVIKEIESSALGKHMVPAPNGALVLRGCRVLTLDETAAREGETFLGGGGRGGGDGAVGVGRAPSDGLPWWAARGAPGERAARAAGVAAAPAEGEADPFDDCAAVRAERAERAARDARGWRRGEALLSDDDVDAILGADNAGDEERRLIDEVCKGMVAD